MIESAPAGTYPRPLSEREAEILRFLLSVDDDRLTPLREQASSAVVTGRCACPCATIDLGVDRKRFPPTDLCSPVVSTTTIVDEIEAYGLLLFLDRGWLSRLEIWYINEPPVEFPPPVDFDPPKVEC